jgi:hypothetical protein
VKKLTLGLFAALLLAAPSPAGPPVGPPAPGREARATHDTELAAAETFLYGKVPADSVNYIRFFTTFAVPEQWTYREEKIELRKQAELCLPFALNSVSGYNADGFVERPVRVPGSDTLWYIDIRKLGWATEDIDAVFSLQPYFLSPLVYGKNPNILFRADWFIVYALDNTKLDDRGIKQFPYYILQYGVNKEPKDKDEFFKFWEVDEKLAERKLAETGSVVDAGDSAVSRHTRRLHRIRSLFGYLWFTKDVKSHDIDPDKVHSRDYVEDLFAKQVDAGEYISSNKRGLQTYLLTAGTNQKFTRVEFGDPTIVQDRQDPHDGRVRTAKSCVTCHAFGIIPYTNVFKELFAKGGDILTKYEDLQRELKSFYLRYEDGEEVREDNRLFASAIKKCNGLTPEANLKVFLDVYNWYWNTKVDLEQAAVEVGLPVPEYKEVLKKATTGRLVLLYHGKAMSREIWDSVNLGGYVQSVLLAKALGKDMEDAIQKHAKSLEAPKNAKERTQGAETRENEQSAPAIPYEAEVVNDCTLVDEYSRPVVNLGKGSRVRVTRADSDGVIQIAAVDGNGRQLRGYVFKRHTRPVR